MNKIILTIFLFVGILAIATLLYSGTILNLTGSGDDIKEEEKNVKINNKPFPDWRHALQPVPSIKDNARSYDVEIVDPYDELRRIQSSQQEEKHKKGIKRITTSLDKEIGEIKYDLNPIQDWRNAIPEHLMKKNKDENYILYGDKKPSMDEAVSTLMKDELKEDIQRKVAKDRFFERPFAPKKYYKRKELLGRFFDPSSDLYEHWLDHQSLTTKSDAHDYYVPKPVGEQVKETDTSKEWSDLE